MYNLQSALEQLRYAADERRATTMLPGEPQALLDEQGALLETSTSFDDLPKELVKDNGIEYIRIPYIAFAKWDVKRRAAIQKHRLERSQT